MDGREAARRLTGPPGDRARDAGADQAPGDLAPNYSYWREHGRGVGRELLRVCRGHVLHLETSAEYGLCETAHDGCWQHDLVTLYRELGYESEALEPGYAAHMPVRVVVASAPRFTWSPVVLALYRRLEQDMDAGQTALR